jgi:hypothetical protein
VRDAQAVTDIVDGEHATSAEFLQNLHTAAKAIEDATVDWSDGVAPWVDLADLVAPAQTPDPAAFAAGEKLTFDPWTALEAHRPLGHIQRVRKAAYFTSQQARK